MFEPWRLQIREADAALKNGQLETAVRLLENDDIQQYLPAKKLLVRVADRLASRGRDHRHRGELDKAWQDLAAAAKLGANRPRIDALQSELVDASLAEVVAFLEAGEYDAALARLDELLEHAPASTTARALRQAAVNLQEAHALARRGHLAEADKALAAAAALRSDLRFVSALRKSIAARATKIRDLQQQLHAALGREDWNMVAEAAESILEQCPEHTAAREARRRAWEAVGMRTSGMAAQPEQAPTNSTANNVQAMQGTRGSKAPDKSSATGERFFLWIDTVGGFLVCTGDTVVLGQPDQKGEVDVPLLGDLSRKHAIIRRVGEGYLLEPLREVRVNGEPTGSAMSLADGALIELGEGVRLHFRRPHPLSATARLEFASSHRTQPKCDAVLLLADTCVLGPSTQSHVVCPDWKDEVVVCRQQGDLFCRTTGSIDIDGVACQGRARINTSSRVSGDDWTFSLESVPVA